MLDGPWLELAHFHSHDLVKRDLEKRHGHLVNDEYVWHVLSAFRQATHYFTNAKTAAEEVKPLLLYYGVLSLSRGLILVSSDGLTEDDLSHSHGLKAQGWNKAFVGGIEKVFDLEVLVSKKGTFAELWAVISKVDEQRPIAAGPISSPYDVVRPPRTAKSPLGQTVTFDMLLSREPDLAKTYSEVTGRRSNIDWGTAYVTNGAYIVSAALTTDELPKSENGPLEFATLRQRFGLHSNHEVRSGNISLKDQMWGTTFRAELTHFESFPDLCPIQETWSESGMGDLIRPLSKSLYLEPIVRCFALAYFLGMLTRYFPSRWMGLLNNRPGDYAFPLLKAAVAYVENQFPLLALRYLKGRAGRQDFGVTS